jgi:hypothetical protein
VNEIQLIRSQLGAERDRACAVAGACAGALAGADAQRLTSGSALAGFHQAGVEYLTCVLAWFDERDQRLRQLYARLPDDDPDRRAVERILAGGGGSREALERLKSVAANTASENGDRSRSGGHERWQEISRFLAGPWKAQRDAIEQMLSSHPRVGHWRAVAGVNADSILEERRRYACFRQHLPQGRAAPAGL